LEPGLSAKENQSLFAKLSGLMSFQHFSRQARGDPSGTQEEEVPIWKKNMWSTMEGIFLFIGILIRKSGRTSSPFHFVPSAICDQD
jgi:hypothetical protein